MRVRWDIDSVVDESRHLLPRFRCLLGSARFTEFFWNPRPAHDALDGNHGGLYLLALARCCLEAVGGPRGLLFFIGLNKCRFRGLVHVGRFFRGQLRCTRLRSAHVCECSLLFCVCSSLFCLVLCSCVPSPTKDNYSVTSATFPAPWRHGCR